MKIDLEIGSPYQIWHRENELCGFLIDGINPCEKESTDQIRDEDGRLWYNFCEDHYKAYIKEMHTYFDWLGRAEYFLMSF